MPGSSSCQAPVLASVYQAKLGRKVFAAIAVFTVGTVILASAGVNTYTLASKENSSTLTLASVRK